MGIPQRQQQLGALALAAGLTRLEQAEGAPVVRHRVLVGEQARGSGTGAARVVDRLADIAQGCGLSEVVRQPDQVRRQIRRLHGFDRLPDPLVEVKAAGEGQLGVQGFAEQRVRKGVAPGNRLGRQRPCRHRFIEHGQQRCARLLAHPREQLQVEIAPDDGSDLERLGALRRKPIETPPDDVPHGWRHANGVGRGVLETAFGRQPADHFTNEERVAFGLPRDAGDHRRGRLAPRDAFDQTPDVGLAQTDEQQSLGGGDARQLGERLRQRLPAPDRLVAVRAEDEKTRVLHLAGQKLQKEERGRIRPMEIVEHEQQRLSGRDVLEKRRHTVEESKAFLLRLQLRRRRKIRQPFTDGREHSGDVGGPSPHGAQQVFCAGGLYVPAHRLDPGPVFRRAASFVAATPENSHPALLGMGGELLCRAGLADARLTPEQQDPAAPAESLFDRHAERHELLLPPDENAGLELVGPDADTVG